VKYIDIFGINVCNGSENEIMDLLKGFFEKKKIRHIVTLNSMMIMRSFFDKGFRQILQKADLIVPDSIGVGMAFRMKGEKLIQRLPGVDLARKLMNYSEEENKTVYLLGGKKHVSLQTEKNIKSSYRNLRVIGRYHGYFKDKEEESVFLAIRKSCADLVLVSIGSPKQEKLIAKYRDNLNSKILLGIGGAFDIYSGTKKRAPVFFQKNNMEWFYRIITQPRKYYQFFILLAYFFICLGYGVKVKVNKILKKGKSVPV